MSQVIDNPPNSPRRRLPETSSHNMPPRDPLWRRSAAKVLPLKKYCNWSKSHRERLTCLAEKRARYRNRNTRARGTA